MRDTSAWRMAIMSHTWPFASGSSPTSICSRDSRRASMAATSIRCSSSRRRTTSSNTERVQLYVTDFRGAAS